MVNSDTVNAGTWCLILAYLCENLLDSGRFVRFKNYVKYASRLILTKIRCKRPPRGMKKLCIINV